MVHSDSTAVHWLHKHFSSSLSTFSNYVSIITNCTYPNISASNIMTYVNNSFSFFKLVFTSYVSSILPAFCPFSTWTAQDDLDLRFSLILVTKANAVQEGTTSAMWLYHQHKRSIHVTDIVTVTSLSHSLQHKKSEAMDSLCQIVLNQKLSCKFNSGVNFQVTLKWCHAKRNCIKQDLCVLRHTAVTASNISATLLYWKPLTENKNVPQTAARHWRLN